MAVIVKNEIWFIEFEMWLFDIVNICCVNQLLLCQMFAVFLFSEKEVVCGCCLKLFFFAIYK